MITFLSGGTGTPALIRGTRQILYDSDITVVANTAGDTWISGGHCAPDIDTAIFLFAGILDTARWWGIKGDTCTTHNYLPKVAGDEPFPIGDRARAVQIARAALLRRGLTLTEAVEAQCRSLRIGATILPVTDEDAALFVDTGTGRLPLIEYRIAADADTEVRELVRAAPRPPAVTEEVRAAIEASDAVVIGPSNPVTSISPILECAGVREALRRQHVIAVSPFIGDAPISGPAAALMRVFGKEPSSVGTCGLYEDFVDIFIQDIRDPVDLEGALRLDTLMVNRGKSLDLAKSILTLIYGC